jgi:uncharacterized ParB-like nuclease family protein
MNIKYVNQKNKIYFLPTANRVIIPNHVTKLANSINKWGLLRPLIVIYTNVVDGTWKYYIVDGQHTYHALNRLNMEIPYVVCHVEFDSWNKIIQCIADLNTSSKSWQFKDFIQSWATIKDDYKILFKYLERYDFEARFTAAVLADMIEGTTVGTAIKNGTFKIYDQAKATAILSDLTQIFHVIGFRGNRFETKYFCNEYYKFRKQVGESYVHKKFLTEVKKTAELYQFLDGELGKLSNFFKTLL